MSPSKINEGGCGFETRSLPICNRKPTTIVETRVISKKKYRECHPIGKITSAQIKLIFKP